jgi:hypothetical protein
MKKMSVPQNEAQYKLVILWSGFPPYLSIDEHSTKNDDVEPSII